MTLGSEATGVSSAPQARIYSISIYSAPAEYKVSEESKKKT